MRTSHFLLATTLCLTLTPTASGTATIERKIGPVAVGDIQGVLAFKGLLDATISQFRVIDGRQIERYVIIDGSQIVAITAWAADVRQGVPGAVQCHLMLADATGAEGDVAALEWAFGQRQANPAGAAFSAAMVMVPIGVPASQKSSSGFEPSEIVERARTLRGDHAAFLMQRAFEEAKILLPRFLPSQLLGELRVEAGRGRLMSTITVAGSKGAIIVPVSEILWRPSKP